MISSATLDQTNLNTNQTGVIIRKLGNPVFQEAVMWVAIQAAHKSNAIRREIMKLQMLPLCIFEYTAFLVGLCILNCHYCYIY